MHMSRLASLLSASLSGVALTVLLPSYADTLFRDYDAAASCANSLSVSPLIDFYAEKTHSAHAKSFRASVAIVKSEHFRDL